MSLASMFEWIKPEQVPLRRELLAIAMETEPERFAGQVDVLLQMDTEYTALWLAKHAHESIRLELAARFDDYLMDAPEARMALVKDPDLKVRTRIARYGNLSREEVLALLQDCPRRLCSELLNGAQHGKLDNASLIEVWHHLLRVHKTMCTLRATELRKGNVTKQQVIDYLQLCSQYNMSPGDTDTEGLAELMRYVILTKGHLGDELQAALLNRFGGQADLPIDLTSVGEKTRAYLESTELGQVLLPILQALESSTPLTRGQYLQAHKLITQVPGLLVPLVRAWDDHPSPLLFASLQRYRLLVEGLHHLPPHWGEPLWMELLEELDSSHLGVMQELVGMYTTNYGVRKLAEAGSTSFEIGMLLSKIPGELDLQAIIPHIPVNEYANGGSPIWQGVLAHLADVHDKLTPTAFSYVVRRIKDWSGTLPELIELADALYGK